MRRLTAELVTPSTRVLRTGAVAAAALLAVLLLVAARAGANHIPGATYNGTVAGGTPMSLTVFPDGSGVTSFTSAGPLEGGPLEGGTCAFTGLSLTWGGSPLPIINHAFSFSDTVDPIVSLSGTFPTFQGAQGTLRVNDRPSSCDTGDLAWSATTTATPPPPPPPPPDTTAPALQLSGATSQKVLRQRGVLVVAASSSEESTVTGKGTVSIRGSAKVFKLTPVATQIPQGSKATLKLKLKRKALSAIGQALKKGKRVTAKVTVTAEDSAGNVTTKRRNVRLKR